VSEIFAQGRDQFEKFLGRCLNSSPAFGAFIKFCVGFMINPKRKFSAQIEQLVYSIRISLSLSFFSLCISLSFYQYFKCFAAAPLGLQCVLLLSDLRLRFVFQTLSLSLWLSRILLKPKNQNKKITSIDLHLYWQALKSLAFCRGTCFTYIDFRFRSCVCGDFNCHLYL